MLTRFLYFFPSPELDKEPLFATHWVVKEVALNYKLNQKLFSLKIH